MVYPMVPAGANLDEMISRPVHEQFEDAEMQDELDEADFNLIYAR